jgi:hypothetical protein
MTDHVYSSGCGRARFVPVARDPGESRGLLHCPLGTVAVHDCEESALVLVLIYYPDHRAVCSGGSDPSLMRAQFTPWPNALSTKNVHSGDNYVLNNIIANNFLLEDRGPIASLILQATSYL